MNVNECYCTITDDQNSSSHSEEIENSDPCCPDARIAKLELVNIKIVKCLKSVMWKFEMYVLYLVFKGI